VTDEVRTRAGSHTTPLAIRAGAWTDGVRIAVRSAGDSASTAPAEARPPAARLSLSLARRIVEMHGGALEDRRTEAAGEIVLTLPAA